MYEKRTKPIRGLWTLIWVSHLILDGFPLETFTAKRSVGGGSNPQVLQISPLVPPVSLGSDKYKQQGAYIEGVIGRPMGGSASVEEVPDPDMDAAVSVAGAPN
eukprot:2516494-Amphidinium_carterae.1